MHTERLLCILDIMAQKESNLIKKHMLSLDKKTQVRFRFNAGRGWNGKPLRGPDIRKYVNTVGTKDCLLLVKPRPFIGAPEGFPDVAGWDSVEITSDMVGQRVAIFVGDEFKTGRQQLSKAQRLFGNLLSVMGGIFSVIRG